MASAFQAHRVIGQAAKALADEVLQLADPPRRIDKWEVTYYKFLHERLFKKSFVDRIVYGRPDPQPPTSLPLPVTTTTTATTTTAGTSRLGTRKPADVEKCPKKIRR